MLCGNNDVGQGTKNDMLLRYPIVSYFILSFAIAWSVWIPIGMLVAEPSVAVILPGALLS